jgi:hypothetical protein
MQTLVEWADWNGFVVVNWRRFRKEHGIERSNLYRILRRLEKVKFLCRSVDHFGEIQWSHLLINPMAASPKNLTPGPLKNRFLAFTRNANVVEGLLSGKPIEHARAQARRGNRKRREEVMGIKWKSMLKFCASGLEIKPSPKPAPRFAPGVKKGRPKPKTLKGR